MAKNPSPLRSCPACRWITRDNQGVCPRCGMVLRRPNRLARWWRDAAVARQPATLLLLAVLVLFYLITHILAALFYNLPEYDGAGYHLALWALGSLSPREVLAGEWWRLSDHMFLHGDLLHIIFNGMALYNLGCLAESIYGSRRLWVAFFLTGLAGGAASLGWKALWGEAAGTVGASGAICGLMGLLLGLWHFRGGIDGMLAGQLKRWAVILVVYGVLLAGTIDNAAHAGGFVSGFLLAYAMAPEGRGYEPRALTRLWRAAAWACLAAALLAQAPVWHGMTWSAAGEYARIILNFTAVSV